MRVEEIPASVFDTMIRQAGWHFMWVVRPCVRKGFGLSRDAATTRVLVRALRSVASRFNAAELDSITVAKYPGFYIADTSYCSRARSRNTLRWTMSTGGILRLLRLDRTTDAGTLKGSWDERRYDDLAELATKSVVVSTQMPPLHLRQIQTGRVAFVRRSSQLVRASPGALYVLLAAILLVLSARRGMSVLYYDSGLTSNDLLHRLMANHSLFRSGPARSRTSSPRPADGVRSGSCATRAAADFARAAPNASSQGC